MRNRDWGGKLGKIVIRAIVRMMTMMMIMVMRTNYNGGNKDGSGVSLYMISQMFCCR